MTTPPPPASPRQWYMLTQRPSCRQYLDRVRTVAGPFASEGFDGSVVLDAMDNMKIL